MIALQAQDFRMASIAVGLRTSGCTSADVESAVQSGTIIRTHLLRPTWHFASRNDLRWLISLSAPQIRRALGARHRQLEMTPSILRKSNRIIEQYLGRHGSASRDELTAEFLRAGFRLNDNRAAHLLLLAEIDALICSGGTRNGKPTYALFADRIPEAPVPPRDEALSILARRYFASRGPATLKDFTWWSGLRVPDASRGLDGARSSLSSFIYRGLEYWFKDPDRVIPPVNNRVLLLPAFDEFLVGYADRSHVIDDVHMKEAVTINGIFRPVLLTGGVAAGIWEKKMQRGIPEVTVRPFRPLRRPDISRIKAAAGFLKNFYGTPINLQPGPFTKPSHLKTLKRKSA
jgi:hypothetical protein